MKEIVVVYYEKFFGGIKVEFMGFFIFVGLLQLNDRQIDDFVKLIFCDEVRYVIMKMGFFKVFGEGGFFLIFFQKSWDLVGFDFCRLVS